MKALAATLVSQAGVPWGCVPANLPMRAPASPLLEPANFARATTVIGLFAPADGIVVERDAAAKHRANVVR